MEMAENPVELQESAKELHCGLAVLFAKAGEGLVPEAVKVALNVQDG
jgi:hypothetical protein